MTALTEQCDVIRSWLNLGPEVYPDAVVTSWIRMAEESVSKRLRCKEMIQIDTGLIVEHRYLLPSDWRAIDFIRVIGDKPLRYTPRDDYYNPDQNFLDDLANVYTVTGNYVIIGAAATAGTNVEISYYQDIPPLGDDTTWFVTKYPTLFTLSVLHIASMYAIEDERQATWSEESAKLVDEINGEHLVAKASGSRLTQRHRRSFG